LSRESWVIRLREIRGIAKPCRNQVGKQAAKGDSTGFGR
jgi:hypothetical protein